MQHRSGTPRRSDQAVSNRAVAPAAARQQSTLNALGLRVMAGPVQQGLDDAAECVADTLNVELAGVLQLVDDGRALLLRAGVGWARNAVNHLRHAPDPDALVTQVITSGAVVVSQQALADFDFGATAPMRAHRPRSAVALPIGPHDRPLGVLIAFGDAHRRFARPDMSFLQSVAIVLANLFDRAAAEEQLRKARDIERQRIARALHDAALGELSYALTLAQRPSCEPASLVPALERIGQQLRAAIYDLRLSDQEDRSFRTLLETLVTLQRGITPDMAIVLQVEPGLPEGPLGPLGTELLHIIGEALTNARRHSRADRVRISVWGSWPRIGAEISDNGIGFDLESSPTPAQQGLRDMRERAAGLGGSFVLDSEPGTGTTVHVEVQPAAQVKAGAAPVRILLVDDHAAVREALAAAFERDSSLHVVGQAHSLGEARHLLADVDLAVLDLGLPDGSGAELIAELRRHSPRAQALVLTASLDRADIAEAVRHGAAAVLHKAVRLDVVLDSVRRLAAGETLMPPDEVIELLRFAGRRLEREHQDRLAIGRLTSREREVLQTLADGLDSRTSAERLCITVRTQRNHIANIEAKLGVHSQLQALLVALRYGVVRLPDGAEESPGEP